MRGFAHGFMPVLASFWVFGCGSPTTTTAAKVEGAEVASDDRARPSRQKLEIARSDEVLEVPKDGPAQVATTPFPDDPPKISLPKCQIPTGVYFSDIKQGTISRIDLATRQTKTIVSAMADDLALDSQNRQLYFPVDDKAIFRVGTEGSGLGMVVGDLPSPYCLALDLVGKRIFFTNQIKEPRIQSYSLNTKKSAHLVAGSGCCTIGLALDVARQHMYWMEGYYKGHVVRARVDGSYEQVIATTVGIATGIDVDSAAGKVYWTEYGNGPSDDVVRRANLDGTRLETLLTAANGLSTPQHIAVDPAGGHFYLADLHAGRVLRAKLDGSQVETLWRGSGLPRAIALDRPEPCR